MAISIRNEDEIKTFSDEENKILHYQQICFKRIAAKSFSDWREKKMPDGNLVTWQWRKNKGNGKYLGKYIIIYKYFGKHLGVYVYIFG